MKRVLLIAALFTSHALPLRADSAWNEDSWTLATHADLTGDGKLETIRVESFFRKVENSRSSENYFCLTINGHRIYDALPGSKVQALRLVNINSRDRWKEIEVAVSDGEWRQFFIYWFDGKRIRRVIAKPMAWMTFPGDGRVLRAERVNAPVNLELTYDLQPGHTLRLRKQRFYPINASFKVREPFPIYTRPGLQRIAMLRVGTRVHVLQSDLGNWLLVRAGRKTYGWMNTRWNSAYTAFGVGEFD